MIGVHRGQEIDLARYGWARDLLLSLAAIRNHALEEFDAARRPRPEGAPEAKLNLFLLLCAVEQVIADHLSRGGLDLSPVRRRAGSSRAASRAIGLAEGTVEAVCSIRSSLAERGTARRLERVRAITLAIATDLAAHKSELPIARSEVEALFADLDPELAGRCMKIPSCFRAQDLLPADCHELARRFLATTPTPKGVLVVGVRTSGSYMAPLVAGWLRAKGLQAGYTTIRPKAPLVALERVALRRQPHTSVLIVDDPPMTGGSFVRTARRLESCGIPRSAVTFLVPLGVEHALGEDERRRFDVYRRVELLSTELEVRGQLRSAELLAFVAAGAGATSVTPLLSSEEVELLSRRRHVKQVYAVRGAANVHVKGVGLGWLGYPARHACAALGDCVPETLGFWNTLMVTRERVAETVVPTCEEAADYVARRSISLRLPQRQPATEFRKDGYYRLAKVLARVHGPLAPLGMGPIRRLLATAGAGAPACLIDGRMAPDEWIGPSPPVKGDFEEHAFDKDDLALYDPAYDLAGALLERGPDREAERVIVSRFIASGGDPEIGSRLSLALLLYGAFLLERRSWEVEGDRGTSGWPSAVQAWLEAEAGLTWTVDRLLADAYSAPRPASASAVWSIDVDGVLEDAGLGFPATTPAAAAALQEARRAGAAVVLNSGRSLPELVLRCDALNLDGAVAEYGSAIWSATTGLSESLLDSRELDRLERVRLGARELSDVHVDSRYRNSVRLRRFIGARPVALTAAQVDHLQKAAGREVVAIQGMRQTDFVSRWRNKGEGFLRLRERMRLGADAFAIGDSEPDVSVARVVTRAYAPRFRDEALEGVAVHLAADRQRAVLEAVRREHGRHGSTVSPGLPAVDAELLPLLALRDSSRTARAMRAFRPGMLEVFRT